MDSQIVAAVIAVLGTLGGAAVTAWVQRETKKIAALERRVERYKAEIRARQAEEDVAAEWLAELDVCVPSCCQDAAARTNRAKTRHTSEHPGQLRSGSPEKQL